MGIATATVPLPRKGGGWFARLSRFCFDGCGGRDSSDRHGSVDSCVAGTRVVVFSAAVEGP